MSESETDLATGRTTELVRGTSIRPLSRILAAPFPIWSINGEGELIYLSPSCGGWLGIDPQQLIGKSVFHEHAKPEPTGLDALAISLAPPSRHLKSAVTVRIHPCAPAAGLALPTPQDVTFIPIGDDHHSPLLAIARPLLPQASSEPSQLHTWREVIAQQLAVDPRRAQAIVTLGTSIWAQRLRRQIDVAIDNPTCHVTLFGARGCDAVSIARLIHWGHKLTANPTNHSTTAQQPPLRDSLVRVAGSLMDAELFDATTGDVVQRYLEAGGQHAAIVVEDLDQMPADAQERLRLLVNNLASRLRVFATCSTSSQQLISSLSADLAAQLGQIELLIPDLCQRSEDIPVLATALLHRRHSTGETTAEQIGRDCLDRLLNYPWPNNFEELDAAVRNAARQCRTATIQVEHLPLAIRSYGAPAKENPTVENKPLRIRPLDEALASYEKDYLLKALQRTSGNRAAAARLLEISRPRLLRRLEQLGIDETLDSSGSSQ